MAAREAEIAVIPFFSNVLMLAPKDLAAAAAAALARWL